MKLRILMIICAVCFVGKAQAQWVTFDPGNLAQGIINTAKNVIETSTTASNMINNFAETKKIYEQGKKFYDALRKVNDLVKDARKVQQTILMIGDITDVYVNSFQVMMRDDNFTIEELSAIAYGYTRLLEESNELLKEVKEVVNITTLQMSDNERMDVIDRVYNAVRNYRNMVVYFTNKNISVSYLRSKRSGDSDAIVELYRDVYNKYW